MDRIDLHIDLPPVTPEKLISSSLSESSKKVKKRIQIARDIQVRRYRQIKKVCNGDLNSQQVKEYILLSPDCIRLLKQAVATLHLSARTYYKAIKIARTIADLTCKKEISSEHLAEALQYRPKECT